MQKWKNIKFLGLAIAVTGLAIIGCNKSKDRSSGSGTPVTLKVGQVTSSSATLMAKSRGVTNVGTLAYAASDVVPSTGSYSFAHVDGLKISVREVMLKSGNNYVQAASWPSGTKSLEIGAGVTGAIQFSETISLEPGNYTGAVLRYDNAYSVKAYCATSTKFVYTSAAGIQTLGSVPTSLPSDYDYYDYQFAEVSTAESPTSTTDTSQADTDSPFTVTSAGGQVAVLVDPSFLVACYDGVSSSLGMLSPFTWTNNNGHATTEFFPTSAANFGMGYIPMFVWISGDTTATPPTADTYFIGTSSGAVTASPVDYSQVGIATVAFNSDNSLYAMRGRITSSSVGLYQMFNGFNLETDNTYTIYNGEWQCDAGYVNCHQIQDRKLTGFSATSDYTTVRTVTLDNGPDCGKTGYFPGHESDWGNRYRACLGSPTSIYFKKVQK